MMNTLDYCDEGNTTHSLVEFLLSMPGSNMLTTNDLEMLDKIMLVNQYPDGHKFKSADNIYLIINGDVAVSYKNECGIFQLDRIHSGELFGFFSFIDKSKQAAMCTAVGSVRAASLPLSAFQLLINSKLPLANYFRRIVNTTNDVNQNYMKANIASLSQSQWCDLRIQ